MIFACHQPRDASRPAAGADSAVGGRGAGREAAALGPGGASGRYALARSGGARRPQAATARSAPHAAAIDSGPSRPFAYLLIHDAPSDRRF